MAAPNALQSTVKLYQSVVEDVVLNVKEAFLDEGVDEAVLQELKLIWEGKILATKTVDSLDPNHTHHKSTSFTSSASHSTDNCMSNSTNHHFNASTSNFHHGMANGRHFTSKIKSQPASVSQNVPQVIVLNHNHQQQQQQPTEHGAEYNLSAVRPMSIIHNQESINNSFSSTGRILSSAPLGACIRGLPHSVITHPQHLLMQVAGGAHANLANRTHNLLPPPLTSSVLQQHQQHHQLTNQQLRFDKLPINSASSNPNIAPGSNVIVLPPHLQQLVPNIIQMNGNNNNAGGSSSASGDARSGHKQKVVIQLDGPGGVSDEDDDEEFVEEDEDEDINVEDESEDQPTVHAEEGDALNSEDDEVSNENADEMFEADDVIVCQFEKVNRIRNKWKFVLKDGIINLGRKDYVFNRAVGEAEF